MSDQEFIAFPLSHPVSDDELHRIEINRIWLSEVYSRLAPSPMVDDE